MRSFRHAFVLTPMLLVACSRSSSTPASAASPATPSAASAATPGTPPGARAAPMFHATYMGMDMSRPLTTLDLTPGGLPGLSITGPEGAQITTERHAAMLVSAGANYSLSVRERAFDAASATQAFHALDPQGTFVVDDPELKIFQRSGSGGFLFEMGTTVGDRQFVCGSVATAQSFARSTIDETVASCRTLRPSGG